MRRGLAREGFARTVLYWVYAAVATIYGTRFMLQGLGTTLKFDWNRAPIGDAQVDWVAAQLFLLKQSPYTPEGLAKVGVNGYGFGHPPTTPFWFIPLANLDYAVFAEFIALATIACLMISVWLIATELRLPARFPTVLLVTGFALTTDWMILHLHVIQISEFIAFAYVMGWYYLRRDRQISGGIALGAACTLKLFPGVLVLWLLVTRRFKAVAAACVTYGIVAVTMTTGYGFSCWKLFFKQQEAIAHYWIGHIRNSSLHGIVIRIFNPVCEVLKGDPMASVSQYNQLPEIPALKGATLAKIASVLCILAGGYLVMKYIRRGPNDARRHQSSLDLVFAFATTLSAFVNPWVWEHYDVLLIMPMLVCLDSLRHRWTALYEDFAHDELNYGEILRAIGASLLVLGGLGTTLWILQRNSWFRETYYEAYERLIWGGTTPTPEQHHLLHREEVLGWLQWPSMLLATGVLLVWGIRAAKKSAPRALPAA
ncbi:MAG: glycosyltransferase family 87 protein [Polyangiaceae bacterium]